MPAETSNSLKKNDEKQSHVEIKPDEIGQNLSKQTDSTSSSFELSQHCNRNGKQKTSNL